jgi:hypothetical protein
VSIWHEHPEGFIHLPNIDKNVTSCHDGYRIKNSTLDLVRGDNMIGRGKEERLIHRETRKPPTEVVRGEDEIAIGDEIATTAKVATSANAVTNPLVPWQLDLDVFAIDSVRHWWISGALARRL